MNELMISYLVWNLVVALFYGMDKSRAVRGVRRISERNLILVPMAVIVQIAVIWYVFYMGGTI